MKIDLRTENIELTERVREIVNEKLGKLGKKLLKFPSDVVLFTVLIKKRKHQTGQGLFRVSVRLEMPFGVLYAKENGYVLDEGVNKAVGSIDNQLEKVKTKLKG